MLWFWLIHWECTSPEPN